MSERRAMTEAELGAQAAAMEKLDDWTATCPKCRVALRGTLAQMRGHKCAEAEAAE